MPTPELLAPAGSFDALRAAAWAGANAVYLGGKSFNARASAANFSNDELAKAIIFAHRSNVKVYVTVNTLLKDNEIEQAVGFLNDLYNMGADAVIIQDIGLLKLAAKYVPMLERHASTQTTAASLASVKALKNIGAQRVVLSRELTADEIREIADASILPIEIFVHGALCVAYSGQCLYSSLVGGRSGNRGQCAQPCRLPFKGETTYPLSPKDLCLIEHVPQLLSLGASSWKIEGRLKRPEYVAEVVSIYRKAIDRAKNSVSFTVDIEDSIRLKQAFNRGFTQGYLHGKPKGSFYSGVRPDNQGVIVGEVQACKGFTIKLRFFAAVGEGDVCDLGYPDTSFTVSQKQAHSGAAELKLKQKLPLAPGSPVYRLVHAARNRELTEAISRFEPPLTDVEFHFTGHLGEYPRLQVCSSQACTIVAGANPLEAARSQVNSSSLVERQLHKLGGTPFRASSVSLDMAKEAFISAGEINALRRAAIDQLTVKLWGQEDKTPPPLLMRHTIKREKKATKLGVAVGTAAEARAAILAGADYLIYGREWSEFSVIEHIEQYTQLQSLCEDVILRLPRIMHNAEEAQWRRHIAKNTPILANSLGGISLALDVSDTIFGDSGLNITNSYSGEIWPNVQSVTLSHELNCGEVFSLAEHSKASLEMVVHGRQLLMVHGNCLWSPSCKGKETCKKASALVDRKGVEFPVATDYYCRSYILNSQVLSLIDAVPVLMQSIDKLRLELAGAGADRVRRTVKLYKQAMVTDSDRDHLAKLRTLVAEEWGLLTRGHWLRGV